MARPRRAAKVALGVVARTALAAVLAPHLPVLRALELRLAALEQEVGALRYEVGGTNRDPGPAPSTPAAGDGRPLADCAALPPGELPTGDDIWLDPHRDLLESSLPAPGTGGERRVRVDYRDAGCLHHPGVHAEEPAAVLRVDRSGPWARGAAPRRGARRGCGIGASSRAAADRARRGSRPGIRRRTPA